MSLKKKLAAAAIITVPVLLGGCDLKTPAEVRAEAQDRREQAMKRLQQEWNLKQIDLPPALYDSSQVKKGSYEITVEIDGKDRACLANVITTTHGLQNVILTNCR